MKQYGYARKEYDEAEARQIEAIMDAFNAAYSSVTGNLTLREKTQEEIREALRWRHM